MVAYNTIKEKYNEDKKKLKDNYLKSLLENGFYFKFLVVRFI